MNEPKDNAAAPDENQIMAERRAKLQELRAQGQAFPNDFRRNALAGELHVAHGTKESAALENPPVVVSLAGRMMLKRLMGKASFATLQDMSGRMQVYVTRDAIGEAAYEAFKHHDLGDILGVTGHLFKTRTGELTVHVTALRLLSKALRPLPEKFHGLTDTEQKYRQRYLDLITNPDAQRVFKARSRILQTIREFFVDRGYLEVETPMMHPIPGGAAARPFVTHHNALDMELYLRIAPELYLKRLVVGGMEKVFEINRNFRNEGISTRHNPEFTMIEFYEAYQDFHYLMDLTEALFRDLAVKVSGGYTISYQGRSMDLSRPFDRLTMPEAVHKYNPQWSLRQLNDAGFLVGELAARKVAIKHGATLGELQLLFFEETTEEQLFDPTFIIDYPEEVSPLARRNDANPAITDRFELFVTGREMANGFSELNDPEDQAARFMEQARQKEAGDAEAMHYDADYIRALEYGLPPTAGEGIGVDRLVMLFTDSPSIRDVILFPQLRRAD
jgi:lysyl-tRNA synthetase class 2